MSGSPRASGSWISLATASSIAAFVSWFVTGMVIWGLDPEEGANPNIAWKRLLLFAVPALAAGAVAAAVAGLRGRWLIVPPVVAAALAAFASVFLEGMTIGPGPGEQVTGDLGWVMVVTVAMSVVIAAGGSCLGVVLADIQRPPSKPAETGSLT